MPAILAALILALAFASCDNGTGAGSGGTGTQDTGTTGTLTITGLQRFAGGTIEVWGTMPADSFGFIHLNEIEIPGSGTVTIELIRGDVNGVVAWADGRNVIFEVEIYNADGENIAKGESIPVDFSGGSASFTDADIAWEFDDTQGGGEDENQGGGEDESQGGSEDESEGGGQEEPQE